jgi:hypothetical protein
MLGEKATMVASSSVLYESDLIGGVTPLEFRAARTPQ